jgi:hypothetical protein
MLTFAAAGEFTITVILFEETGERLQDPVGVIITFTISLFDKEVLLNVAASMPAAIPFTFQAKEGVPALAVVAVKVTLAPEQIVVLLAAIDAVGVEPAVTVIVMLLEVAVPVVLQAAFEVITTLTTSLFAKEELVKEGEFVPAANPFNCQA